MKLATYGRVKALDRWTIHVAKSTGERTWMMKKEHLLKPQNDGCGYCHVILQKDNKRVLKKVHVLVAETFLGYDVTQYDRKNIDSLVVNHIDENKKNNIISNLEIITQRENIDKYFENRRRKLHR